MAEPINTAMTPDAFVQAATNPNVVPAAAPELPENPIIAGTEVATSVAPEVSNQTPNVLGTDSPPPDVLAFNNIASNLPGNKEPKLAFGNQQGSTPSAEGQVISTDSPAAGEVPTEGEVAATAVSAAGIPDAASTGDGSLFASSEATAVDPAIPDDLNSQETVPTNISNFSEVVSKMKQAKERELGLIDKAGNLLAIATDTKRTDEQKVQDVVTMLNDEQMAA